MTELRDAVLRTAADAGRGRSAARIRPCFRRYAAGGHMLYFRASDDAIDITRILHQRMEPDRHL